MGALLNNTAVLEILGVGLVAGVLGGMFGTGGSIVMIPGLTLVLGYNQHLYQAAAMIANVAVSVPAARHHHQTGATRLDVLRWMLPTAVVFVVLGVWLSNLPLFHGAAGGLWLGRLMGVFLAYLAVVNTRRLKPHRADQPRVQPTVTPLRAGAVGGAMGTVAGMLGVGGGTVAVPLQQAAMRLPLPSCIANSSVVICMSATLGAVYKNASLNLHGYAWRDSVVLALLLAPSCWLGGHLGAVLTHRLPIRQVRAAFVLLLIVAAGKMAAIPWGRLFEAVARQ